MAESQKDSERKGVASFKGGAEVDTEEEQVVMTIKGPKGKIVRIEKIDKSGKRHEMPQEEWAKLVGEDELDEIEDALEQAFEAGIAALLGEEFEDDTTYEDDEEKMFRRLLIAGLLTRRRPVQRRILHRLLAGRFLRRRVMKRTA